jgi:hypothetical protein
MIGKGFNKGQLVEAFSVFRKRFISSGLLTDVAHIIFRTGTQTGEG